MSAEPSVEALDQLRRRYELAAMVADRDAAAGFATVIQDIALGPMLAEVIDMIRTRPLAVVALARSADEVALREAVRAKTGYTRFEPVDLDVDLRTRTPRVGLWVDSTRLSVSETVDYILNHGVDALI